MKINMIQYIQKTLAVVLALSLTGCASIISKSEYSVSLQSSPSGAQITIIDERGSIVHKGTTPTMVTLKASTGFFNGADYTVNAKLANGETSTTSIRSEIDGWYIANLLFGGIIGLLIVDPATGAMYKLPESAVLSFSESANIGKGLHILSVEALDSELKKQLIPVKG